MIRRAILVGAVALLAAGAAAASSRMHPEIPLLDAEGNPVLESGKPVSTRRTCGECHDTAFIEGHGYHAWLGFDERRAPGSVPGGRAWDFSPGAFGRWDPRAYDRLTLPGDPVFDQGVADWIRSRGRFHVGGGPAAVREDGKPLGAPGGLDRETSVLDPATGKPLPWDWKASGAVEMDCFLCHVRDADAARRAEALAAGRFAWSATATLAATGLVKADGAGGWRYVREKFRPDGTVDRDRLGLGDPAPAHCGACHMNVPAGPAPVGARGTWATEDPAAAGQVFSAQRVRDSGLNLAGKDALDGAWDVHAERLLHCDDCHHALNNPVRFAEAERSRPRHLSYDARRPEVGDYLQTPVHDFTKGESARPHAAASLDGSMRRCEGCHDAAAAHEGWLPASPRHMEVLLCEACHVPKVHAPAVEATDWTVLRADKSPVTVWRGAKGPLLDPATLIEGYEPAWLPRRSRDGAVRFGPHNLSTTWFWVGGAPERPVRRRDLEAAYFAPGGGYRPEILAALDGDRDGRLVDGELRLDTEAKVGAVARALDSVGVIGARIEGEIEPQGLHHGVVAGARAVRACDACHAPDSRLARPFELSPYVPHGARADLVGGTNVSLPGRADVGPDGRLVYAPSPREAGRHLVGLERGGWIDRAGLALLALTLLAVTAHGGLRAIHARRRREDAP